MKIESFIGTNSVVWWDHKNTEKKLKKSSYRSSSTNLDNVKTPMRLRLISLNISINVKKQYINSFTLAFYNQWWMKGVHENSLGRKHLNYTIRLPMIEWEMNWINISNGNNPPSGVALISICTLFTIAKSNIHIIIIISVCGVRRDERERETCSNYSKELKNDSCNNNLCISNFQL